MVNFAQVMPDWLNRVTPQEGIVEETSIEDQMERDWLSSGVRMFCMDEPGTAHFAKPPEKYRLATSWWLVMLDTFLFLRCCMGLEAFSSSKTAEACKRFLDDTYGEGLVFTKQ